VFEKANFFKDMAFILYYKNRYEKSIEYAKKSLVLFIENKEKYSVDIRLLYQIMGTCHDLSGGALEALKYYYKLLQMDITDYDENAQLLKQNISVFKILLQKGRKKIDKQTYNLYQSFLTENFSQYLDEKYR
jgi:tetratricopeptide (TPR) repeat protein